MKNWKYNLDKDSEQGFAIQEDELIKYKNNVESIKTGKINYIIWHDQYEGGEAYYDDWTLVDDMDVYPNLPDHGWETFEDAYNWIVDNYGSITKIGEETYTTF